LEIEKAIIGMKLVISKKRKKESYLASGGHQYTPIEWMKILK
jgi:hypothetical protein